MGFDSVKLIMAIEEHFNILIPDEVAAKSTTPGEVHEYIIETLMEKRNAKVPEQAKEVVWNQIVDIFVK